MPTIGATLRFGPPGRARQCPGHGSLQNSQEASDEILQRSVHARSRLPLIALLALAASIGIAGCENDGARSGRSGWRRHRPDGPDRPDRPGGRAHLQGGDVSNVGTGSTLTAQQIADIGTLVASIDSATITGNKPVIEITVKTAKGGAVLGLAATTLRLGVAKLVPAANGLPSRWQSYINRSGTPQHRDPGPGQRRAGQHRERRGRRLAGTRQRASTAIRRRSTSSDGHDADRGRLRAGADAPYQRRDRHVGQRSRARAGQPVQGFRAERRRRDLEQADRGDRQLHDLPRALRRARRAAPQRRVLRGLPQPGHGRPGLRRVRRPGLHGALDPPRRGAQHAYVVYGFNGARFDTGEVTYPQPIAFCETCHVQSAATPQGDDWKTNPGAASCGGCHDAGLNKTGPSATTGLYTYTYTHTSTILPPATRRRTAPAAVATARRRGWRHPRRAPAGSRPQGHRERQPVHLQDPERRKRGRGPGAQGDLPDPRHGRHAGGREGDHHGPAAPRLRLVDGRHPQRGGRRRRPVPGQPRRGHRHRPDRQQGERRRQRQRHLQLHAGAGAAGRLRRRDARQGPDGRARRPARDAGRLRGLPGQRLRLRAAARRAKSSSTRPSARPATSSWRCTAAVAPAIRSSARSATTRASAARSTPTTFGPLALGAFIHGLHASNVAPFGAVTYPQSLARCEGCHVAGKFNVARTSALPITVDAGTTLTSGAATLAWKDDLADSATAGTCKGCHTSADGCDAHARRRAAASALPRRWCRRRPRKAARSATARARPSTPRSCTATRCLTASARSDGKNRHDTTFHDTVHDAAARWPGRLRDRAGRLQRRQRAG